MRRVLRRLIAATRWSEHNLIFATQPGAMNWLHERARPSPFVVSSPGDITGMEGHTEGMLEPAVVVVYGIPAGRRQPRRVGTGRLQLRTLVTADTRLDRRMALPKPPRLVRVG